MAWLYAALICPKREQFVNIVTIVFHTFQGGCYGYGDGISDTPPENDIFPDSDARSCRLGRDSCPGGGPDPVDNYMDYSAEYVPHSCRNWIFFAYFSQFLHEPFHSWPGGSHVQSMVRVPRETPETLSGGASPSKGYDRVVADLLFASSLQGAASGEQSEALRIWAQGPVRGSRFVCRSCIVLFLDCHCILVTSICSAVCFL